MSWRVRYWLSFACVIAVVMLAAAGADCLLDRGWRKERAACEAKGRFYWRGNCLPSECSVIRP